MPDRIATGQMHPDLGGILSRRVRDQTELVTVVHLVEIPVPAGETGPVDGGAEMARPAFRKRWHAIDRTASCGGYGCFSLS
jgi:hypothetical protein